VSRDDTTTVKCSPTECEVLRNNALINIHMAHTAAKMGIPPYFFSSSVCVYRDMKPGEPELAEDDAIPANPDNEYGRIENIRWRSCTPSGWQWPMADTPI